MISIYRYKNVIPALLEYLVDLKYFFINNSTLYVSKFVSYKLTEITKI